MQKTKSKKLLSITFESDISPEQTETSGNTASNKKAGGSKGSIWEFIAIASVPLVLVLGNSMLVPILPQMQEQLGISKFQSSLVITLFSVTAGIIIPISGYLSDRFSRKGIMIPSLIIYGAAGVLAGFGAVWKSYWIVIIARAIQGLGAAGTAAGACGSAVRVWPKAVPVATRATASATARETNEDEAALTGCSARRCARWWGVTWVVTWIPSL